jgi:hypothetical protein
MHDLVLIVFIFDFFSIFLWLRILLRYFFVFVFYNHDSVHQFWLLVNFKFGLFLKSFLKIDFYFYFHHLTLIY